MSAFRGRAKTPAERRAAQARWKFVAHWHRQHALRWLGGAMRWGGLLRIYVEPRTPEVGDIAVCSVGNSALIFLLDVQWITSKGGLRGTRYDVECGHVHGIEAYHLASSDLEGTSRWRSGAPRRQTVVQGVVTRPRGIAATLRRRYVEYFRSIFGDAARRSTTNGR